jgi:hypothetical protein
LSSSWLVAEEVTDVMEWNVDGPTPADNVIATKKTAEDHEIKSLEVSDHDDVPQEEAQVDVKDQSFGEGTC